MEAIEKPAIEPHSPLNSILLHLVPGGLIGLAYFALIKPAAEAGYPSIMALMIAIVVALVPFELGLLLFLGYRKNGRISFRGIVAYTTKIPIWNYFVFVPVVFVTVGLLFTLLGPVAQLIQTNYFGWLPPLQTGLDSRFPIGILVATYTMIAIFGMVVGPIVEELYFRGFLLPRMKYAGKFAIFLHSFLFALYHVFTPWMIVSRTLGMIPLAYAAKKKNIYIGMMVHILVNSIDVVTGVLFVVAMTK